MIGLSQISYFGGDPAASDPHWSSVVLLVPFDGNNTDLSPTTPHSLTTTSAPTINSTNPPSFQSQSADYSGTSHYLVNNDADFQFGSGDFTVELYYRPTDVVTDALLTFWNGTTDKGWAIFDDGNGLVEFYYSTTGADQPSVNYSHGDIRNTWKHVAFSRVGNTGYLCFDGLVRATVNLTGVTLYNSTSKLTFGANNQGTSAYYTGRLAGVRITKGVGRYSGAVNDAYSVAPPWPAN